ncbi:PRC-barrel domain-containing protein [Kaistia geumhonensis]|uniref:PRC-barrel domain-containing protein n=1 Tax=Kaistia geumhonensis TaxID=410839 RepID=A0ABU0MBY5_9HYPH|nr:PRC-barrel domain-containing protein [Kaistia geumhonensis]MCX5481417.1 PRC-barrel domain-containing protein [Kaistia geumhonensis]MDQ0518482.1 hypothetical protein [Kaistia geumhonensis]
MTKLFAATALAGMLAVAPAFAQDATPAPATPPAATGDATATTPSATGRFIPAPSQDDWVASRLMGSTVYSPANETLGEINDVVASQDGQVKALVIGVGGFLGIGQKNVAVAPSELQRVADGDSWRYQLNTTKEELNAAAEFKVPEPPTPATTGTTSTSTPSTDMTPPAADGTTTTDPATPMAPAAPSTTTP